MRAGIIASAFRPPPPPDLDFIGAVETAGTPTGVSIPEVPIGTPSPDRAVVVVFHIDTIRYPSSVTIDGITAALDYANSGGGRGLCMARATVPTGTTATVTAVWAYYNVHPPVLAVVYAAPVSLALIGASGVNAVGTSVTRTVDSVAGGRVIAARVAIDQPATLVGVTADHQLGHRTTATIEATGDSTSATFTTPVSQTGHMGMASYALTPPRWVRWLSRVRDLLLGGGRRA